MAYELTTIQTQLKTILDTVSASVLPLKYKYMETKPTSFPAGMIIWGGESPEQKMDTQYNKSTCAFIVRIMIAANESEAHQTALLTLIDAIKNEFRKDDYQTLSGNALDVVVAAVSPLQFSEEYIQPVLYIDISIEITRLKDITT